MSVRLKSANSLLREVEADLRKQADHAEDRFKERLPSAPPALLSQARQAATRIPPGPEHRLHLPLLEGGQIQGFAAYKRVGKRGKPVLATILGPHMEPRDSHLLPSSLLEKAAANRMGKILGAFQRGEGGPQVAGQAKALLSHPTTSGVAHAQMAAPKSLYDLHLDSLPLRPMGSPSLLAAEASVSRDPINLMRALNTRDPGVVAAAAKNPHADPSDLKLVHALRPDFAEANPATHLHRLALPVPDMTHSQAAAEVRDNARRAIHRSAASELARQRLELKTATDLTEASRDKIKDKNFALPGRRYPIHDMNHARAALSMVSAHGTPEEKTQVRAAIASRYPGLAERSESIQKEAAPKTQLFAGLRVRIDRPKGYVQKGKDTEGKPWERVYKCDYGYLAGTQGGDGDGMDVFLGPDEGADAFLIWQKKADGSFDEYKLMLGFKDAYQAKAMYLQHVPAKFMGKIERVPVGMLQGLTGKQVDHSKVAAPAWMRKVRQGLVSLGEVAPEVPHLPTRAQARGVGSALKEDPMSVLSAVENSGAEGLASFRHRAMSPPASDEITPRMRHHIGTTDAFLRDAGDHFVRSTGLPLRISESPPSPAALAEVRAKGYPDHFAIPVTQTDTPIHAHTGGPLARPMGAHELQEVREMGHLLNPPPTAVAAARTPGTPFTSHLGISPILEENLQNWEIPAWQRTMGSARDEVDGVAMSALGSVGNTPWAPTPHDSRASRGAVRAMEHKHRQLEKLMGGSPDMRNAAAQQRQETVRIGITRGTEGLLERVPPEHRAMAEEYLRSSTPEPIRRIFPLEA